MKSEFELKSPTCIRCKNTRSGLFFIKKDEVMYCAECFNIINNLENTTFSN